jgi:hypothetical protein
MSKTAILKLLKVRLDWPCLWTVTEVQAVVTCYSYKHNNYEILNLKNTYRLVFTTAAVVMDFTVTCAYHSMKAVFSPNERSMCAIKVETIWIKCDPSDA